MVTSFLVTAKEIWSGCTNDIVGISWETINSSFLSSFHTIKLKIILLCSGIYCPAVQLVENKKKFDTILLNFIWGTECFKLCHPYKTFYYIHRTLLYTEGQLIFRDVMGYRLSMMEERVDISELAII